MRVLITGGNGFIGRHLAESLLKSGKEVAIYGKHDPANIENTRVSLFGGDITDKETLLKSVLKYNPTEIVHMAALTGISRCSIVPQQAFNVNVYGTFNVVMAAMKTNSRLIFASSREVYGETVGEVTTEDTPLLPNNVYGLTKFFGEKIVTWSESKCELDNTILRFTNVYGPRGDNYGVQKIIKKALQGEKIQVLGGNQIINPVYVDDVVRAISMALENKLAKKEIFNVGSHDNVRLSDLIHKIIENVGGEIETQNMPYRETETMLFRPDLDKINRILGWTPQVDLDKGLLRTIEWYRAPPR
jgi:nucleoside-diphosphate-sugar epimerase